MNSLFRHSLVVGGVVGLIVIALIVGALRPKHASGGMWLLCATVPICLMGGHKNRHN